MTNVEEHQMDIREYCASPGGRLRVMRNGSSIIRRAGVPKPIVIVDTRERTPLPVFQNHGNWFDGDRRMTLKTGDYSVEGMETLLYTSTNRDLAAERAASWLSKHFTYWWLETYQFGRVLIDEEKL